MVWMIPRNGPPVRAGRYLGFDGEVMADVLLAEGEVRLWNSLDPPPARGFLDLGPSTTVLPGLVDCHVHLALPPPRLGDDPLEIMAARLARCLEYGLVAVRDGGDRLGATLELQKEKDLPRLAACGPALHPPGGYGNFLGPAAGPENMLDRIAELAEKGARHIKVLITGPVSLDSVATSAPPRFSAPRLRLLVEEAHRLGLKVMAHVNGITGVRLALACGVDSVEHGFNLDTDTLAALGRSGVTWVPTLAAMAALTEMGPDHHRRAAATAQAAQMKAVAAAHRLGVELAVGTDAGAPGVRHGSSYLRELQLLAQAGLPPAALIRSATLAGTRLLDPPGVNSRRPPAFVAVAGDPLADPTSLQRVRAVIA